MQTQWNSPTLTGEPLGSRDVLACFDGGLVSSDAGGLLLREVEAKFHFVQQFARCLPREHLTHLIAWIPDRCDQCQTRSDAMVGSRPPNV